LFNTKGDTWVIKVSLGKGAGGIIPYLPIPREGLGLQLSREIGFSFQVTIPKGLDNFPFPNRGFANPATKFTCEGRL